MNKILLSVHVIASIVLIGPVTVAASMFPRYARADARTATELLHRITRVYGVAGVAVPIFGLATAGGLGVMGDTWVVISIALTAVAAVVLALVVIPGQRRVLAGATGQAARLAMATGAFNLLWAAVVVLMITRPGSTLNN